jgi:hypothetical protein
MSDPPARPSSSFQALRKALDDSEPLSRLLQRVQASSERLSLLRPLMPIELRDSVKAGPLDDSGWTLLAANAAVASKLRQMLPMFADALAAHQMAVAQIRVKVQAPS